MYHRVPLSHGPNPFNNIDGVTVTGIPDGSITGYNFPGLIRCSNSKATSDNAVNIPNQDDHSANDFKDPKASFFTLFEKI